MGKYNFALALLILISTQAKSFAEEAAPLTGEIIYTGELWQVARGGLESGTVYLHNIDLIFGGDLDPYGLEGSSFFLYGLINNKSELSSELVGDLQVISNIDNSEVFRLYEAWYQHEFPNMRVKLGLIDLNSEFDAIEAAGLFLNSSHGIGPDFSQTGENGPSIFPSTSPAMVIEFTGFEHWRITAGIFDAVPNDPENPKRHKLSLTEGALLIGEVNYTMPSGIGLVLGFYNYTSQFSPLLNPSQVKGGNNGLYGILEAPLTRNIQGWLRIGTANSRLNPLKNYMGGGLVFSEPFTARPNDQLGIAFGWARAGNAYKQVIINSGQQPTNGELNLELTYHYQISDNIWIQPDIQYVINPGSSHALKDALVMGIRFQIGHKFFRSVINFKGI